MKVVKLSQMIGLAMRYVINASLNPLVESMIISIEAVLEIEKSTKRPRSERNKIVYENILLLEKRGLYKGCTLL